MDIKFRIIVFILQFLDFVANLLEKMFGIKFKKITKETVLKGKMSVIHCLFDYFLFKVTTVLCRHRKFL